MQHLDPTHKGMMPELLQRATSLPVIQVTDHLKVLPDHVYVLPPNHDISIKAGALYLSTPAAPRGQRLPINFFLSSLALDYQQQAVAVLLSGMGSDGTAGLAAIKKHAGWYWYKTQPPPPSRRCHKVQSMRVW
ncbi:chemotaxis protein CheB [Nitrincola sp. A-D6]|uniref:chemotaxis protein CheB n=1 Tax=Nitrincola sp. A-D6 TaxID=1545442 RepID=UPI000690A897|nr:chemotaxis protein CheB [Nitrincola sp. A-D6]